MTAAITGLSGLLKGWHDAAASGRTSMLVLKVIGKAPGAIPRSSFRDFRGGTSNRSGVVFRAPRDTSQHDNRDVTLPTLDLADVGAHKLRERKRR